MSEPYFDFNPLDKAPARLTTVAGIESFFRHSAGIDASDALKHCPFCGSVAGFYSYKMGANAADTHPYGACCTNTSCFVLTPRHYQTRELAAAAWNRRT